MVSMESCRNQAATLIIKGHISLLNSNQISALMRCQSDLMCEGWHIVLLLVCERDHLQSYSIIDYWQRTCVWKLVTNFKMEHDERGIIDLQSTNIIIVFISLNFILHVWSKILQNNSSAFQSSSFTYFYLFGCFPPLLMI